MASTSSTNEPSTSSTEELKPSDNWKETPLHYITDWDMKTQSFLFKLMMTRKPFGINKHLNMLLIREELSKELKLNISSKCIWDFLKTIFDLKLADETEGVCFDITEEPFTLPEEYNSIITELNKREGGLEALENYLSTQKE